MFIRLRKPRILVIGSALIDTVAERTTSTPLEESEPAKIIYSIGGSSYNIAVNLALERPRAGVVGLFSYLPPRATTTQLILQRLRQLGVSTRYIRQHEKVNEWTVTAGGFVAIRDKTDRNLFICGVEEIMGEHHLPVAPEEQRLLEGAVAGCRAVVLDTGLNPATIAQLMDLAARYSVPVFVHLVSLKKVANYLQALEIFKSAQRSCPTLCLIGKAPELDALHRELGASTGEGEVFVKRYMASAAAGGEAAFAVDAICRRLQTKGILVTPKRTEDAYLLTAAPEGESRIHLGLKLPDSEKGNLLGVSEALAAAVIYQFCRQSRWRRPRQGIDLEKIGAQVNETARKFCQRVVNSLGATPLSVISRESDADMVDVPLAVKLRRWSDMAYSFTTIVTVVWFAASLLGLLIGFKIYHPRLGGP